MSKCENCNEQIKCKKCGYVIGLDGESNYCVNCKKTIKNCHKCDYPINLRRCSRKDCPCFVNEETHCCSRCYNGKKCALAFHWSNKV